MKRTILGTALAAFAAMPLAVIAVETDTEVVEYFNLSNNHYFVTATAADAQFIDSGGAGQGWVRTGRSFRAWLDGAKAGAGTTPVYRFYSSAANSHFYTASADEVALLRGLEAQERARTGTVTGWQYEGEAFRIEAPVNGSCAPGTIAMQRVYNNGFASGEGANHRFVDDSDLRTLMQERSWIPEGIAFCAQAKSTGTNANLPITKTNFEALSGDFSGAARWKTEIADVERKVTADLAFTFSATGAVMGSGRGCAFTGQVAQGDGFRSLFTGTLAATGCEDPAFDGTYSRFQLERFGNGALAVRLKRGGSANEASVEAVLAGGQPVVTPPTTPTTAPFSGVSGDWSGTISWSAQSRTGDVKTSLVSANQALALKITDAGLLSGNGFGCSFEGTLSPSTYDGYFGGSVTASGCTEDVFNGSYAKVKVKRDDGRLEFELERETYSAGFTTKVEVEGKLVSGATTPTTPSTPPTPSYAGITGDWSGTTSWSAQRRTGEVKTPLVSAYQALVLKITDAGSLSGSGFGCSFEGTLSPSAYDGYFGGSVTASGCTEDVFNGSYTKVKVKRDDGRLEFELERETLTAGVTTKIEIEGKLASGAATTPTPPTTPGTSSGIAGSFAGAFKASIETRTRTGGSESRESTSVRGNVTFTIDSVGALTGTGFGCTFAGTLTPAEAAMQRHRGTVTATDCANATHNGTYAASADPQYGDRLELEMERESETSSVRTKVEIEGTAARV